MIKWRDWERGRVVRSIEAHDREGEMERQAMDLVEPVLEEGRCKITIMWVKLGVYRASG